MARKRPPGFVSLRRVAQAAVAVGEAVYGPPIPDQAPPPDPGEGGAWGIWCVRPGENRRDYSAGWLQGDDRFPLCWHKRYAAELVQAALAKELGPLVEVSIAGMPQNIVRQAGEAPEWFEGAGRDCFVPWSDEPLALPFGDEDSEPPPKGEGVDDDLIHGERADEPRPGPEPVPVKHLVALRSAEALDAVAERKRAMGEQGRWSGRDRTRDQGASFTREAQDLAFVAEALRAAARTGRPILVLPEDA